MNQNNCFYLQTSNKINQVALFLNVSCHWSTNLTIETIFPLIIIFSCELNGKQIIYSFLICSQKVHILQNTQTVYFIISKNNENIKVATNFKESQKNLTDQETHQL